MSIFEKFGVFGRVNFVQIPDRLASLTLFFVIFSSGGLFDPARSQDRFRAKNSEILQKKLLSRWVTRGFRNFRDFCSNRGKTGWRNLRVVFTTCKFAPLSLYRSLVSGEGEQFSILFCLLKNSIYFSEHFFGSKKSYVGTLLVIYVIPSFFAKKWV